MASTKINSIKFTKGVPEERLETLTEEAVLQIKINSKAYTITMRTPGNDLELATGLLLTEGIVNSYQDIISVKETPDTHQKHSLIIDLEISESLLEGKNLFNRSIASSASCGVCGKIELCDLVPANKEINQSEKFNITLIAGMFEQMAAMQATFEQTGGSHAAAIFDVRGNLLSIKEDIGRHNATDKAIGDLMITGKLKKAGVLCISGRVSYEITAKCAQAGISVLAAVSAPSSMAVDFCKP
jgi:FdhD protein